MSLIAESVHSKLNSSGIKMRFEQYSRGKKFIDEKV